MSAIDLFLNYFSRSSVVTIVVLTWLSIYFVMTFSILISKMLTLSEWINKEKASLESMMMGARNVRDDSLLRKCSSLTSPSIELLNVCKNVAEKNATSGLSWLSVIASTSPFIGLFGTVVSILETFSGLGQNSSASLGVIAPAISEALVATAAGIFVAIPAYTAHILIKRKGYEALNLIERQIDILISNVKRDNIKASHDKLG